MIRTLFLLLALLASPALAQTTVSAPALPQSSTSDDITAVRVLNNSGGSWTGGKWVRFGQPLASMNVTSGQSIGARACSNAGCTTGSVVYVGYDCISTHPNNSSCLLADIAVNTQATLANGSGQDFMLVRCGATGQVACAAAPGTAPPSAATVAALSDLATPVFATNGSGGFNETDHCTGNGGTNILAAANTAATTVTRFSNGAFKEYIARGTANSGALNVTCVIDAFQDGTTITDVIIDNNWYQTSGKSDQIYNFSMTVPAGATGVSYHASSGSCSNSFVTGNTHFLYGMWHCKVYGNGQVQSTIQYDVPYFQSTKVVIPHDTSYAVAYASPATPAFGIQDVATCLSAGTGCIDPRATSALGTTIFNTQWNTSGGNHGELAQDPYQYIQWLISQDPTAFKNMLILSEGSGAIPWHVRQETTNSPLNPTTNTWQWDCAHGMSAGDLPANACPNWSTSAPTPSSSGVVWADMGGSGDAINHFVAQSFLPYIATLDYFQQLLFEYETQAEILGVYVRSGQEFSGVSVYCLEHTFLAVRGNAWCMREMLRYSLWGPDSDAAQTSNVKTISRAVLADSMTTLTGLYQYSAAGLAFGFGQLEGVLPSYSAQYGVAAIFQNNYMLTTLHTLASTNYAPLSAQAAAMAGYMVPIISGLVASGNLGFPTKAGSVFQYHVCNVDVNVSVNTCLVEVNHGANAGAMPFATWYQNYQTNLADQVPFNIQAYPLIWGAGSCGDSACSGRNSDVTDWTGGYAIQAVNENAMLWNITQNHMSIEAWAMALAHTYEGMNGANPTMTQLSQVYHQWTSTPQMPNGAYQLAGNAVTDLTNGAFPVTCASANSYLESSGTGIKTLTGCNGGYDVMVGGYSANNYVPGTTGSYMFARYNVTGLQTFAGNAGNHVMYGCGSCASGGSDRFNFPAAANSGSDTIMNFSPAHDTLGVHTNGTCTSAATVVANCMTTSGQDTTLTINGKTVVLKGIRDKNVLTSLITMI